MPQPPEQGKENERPKDGQKGVFQPFWEDVEARVGHGTVTVCNYLNAAYTLADISPAFVD